MLRTTLSDLLRNLLCDRVFADTLPEMVAESIPFFAQLQFTPPERDEQERQGSTLSRDDVHIGEGDRSLVWSSIDQEATSTHTKISQSNRLPLKPILSASSSLSEFEPKQTLAASRHITSDPNVTSLMEDVLENTLWNVMQEAYHNEFSLTARPRLIALPPKRQSPVVPRAPPQVSDSTQAMFPPPPLIMTESFD